MLKLIHLLRILSYPSVPLTQLDQLPPEPGVYYAVRLWRVEYIGLSENLRQRWMAQGNRAHHHKRRLQELPWLRLHYRVLPLERIKLAEAVEISRFRPPMNRVQPNIARLRPVGRLDSNLMFWLAVNFLLLSIVLGQMGIGPNQLWQMLQTGVSALLYN